VDLSNFTRRHANLRVLVFLGHKLRGHAGAAHQLAALAGPQFDVVDDRTDGMFLIGRQLPILMSAARRFVTSPTSSDRREM